MKPKPYIRLSRLRGCFLCTGFATSGSGETMREAWETWLDEMARCGRGKKIPGLRPEQDHAGPAARR